MATAYVFSSSVSWGRSWGLLPNISSILGHTCICWEALRQWIGRDQSHNAVGTFFHVFVSTVSPPFCLFLQTFSLISELIDLARWVKFCIKSKYRLGFKKDLGLTISGIWDGLTGQTNWQKLLQLRPQASLRRIRVSRGSLEPSANRLRLCLRLRRIWKTEDDWERGWSYLWLVYGIQTNHMWLRMST